MNGDVSAVLVAPGFGERGIDGKLTAVTYARENGIPFLGICLGMQCAVIEFARNCAGIKEADSTEFKPESTHPVIDYMEEQKEISAVGATMRLGKYECKLSEGSKSREIYDSELIYERHRHRLELNNKYRDQLEKTGLSIAGVNPETSLVEIVEIASHPWFIGVQFHPELKSTVNEPHPLFVGFVEAALEYSGKKQQSRIKAL